MAGSWPSLREILHHCTSVNHINLNEKLSKYNRSLACDRSVMPARILGKMCMPLATVLIAAKETLTLVNQRKVCDYRGNIAICLYEQIFSDQQADFAMALTPAENSEVNIVRIKSKSGMGVGQYVINTLHEKGPL